MQLPTARRFLAVCLTLFGYLGDVYAGAVLVNSNAIKSLPGASGVKGAETVSPSPRTSLSGRAGHKVPVDTLQVMHFPVRKKSVPCAMTKVTLADRLHVFTSTTSMTRCFCSSLTLAVRYLHGWWRLWRWWILQRRPRRLSALPEEQEALRTGLHVLRRKPLQQRWAEASHD